MDAIALSISELANQFLPRKWEIARIRHLRSARLSIDCEALIACHNIRLIAERRTGGHRSIFDLSGSYFANIAYHRTATSALEISAVQTCQATLFPECLADWVNEDNPVRVIDAFVDKLDLSRLGFEGVVAEATGRPSYHPSVLLKLYIYGYLNRVQSSRRLEREAGRNVEVMWLTGRLTPDHKTIADFRKDGGGAIKQVCVRFIELCRRMGLLTIVSVAIDGSKFKAVNTRDKNFTRNKVERRRAQLEGSVTRYLAQLDTADRQEPSEELASKTAHLQEKLVRLESEIQRLAVMEKLMLASPDQQISLTDPDSRSMATSGRGSGVVGYNAQVAVDTKHHLIIAHEVTNDGSDRAQLAKIACQAKQVLGVDKLEAVADRGYYSGDESPVPQGRHRGDASQTDDLWH